MKFLPFLWLTSGLAFSAAAQSLPAPAAPGSEAETHCLLLPLDPAARAAHVPLIVEAEVLDAQGFRVGNGRIYTRHRLRVYKSLKGSAAAELTVLTEGGTVGLDRQELTNTLRLTPGQQGVFFLEAAAFPGVATGSGWAVYASQQGFVGYDLSSATAAEPFRRYAVLGDELYRTLGATGLREVAPNVALRAALARRAAPAVAAKGQAPLVSSLSPSSLTAGTGAVLTINGSGFGAARGSGSVQFRNADDGGATYTRVNDDDYVSWSDTRIQVRVPSTSATGNPAGTGPVRVTSADQLVVTSLATVQIIYAATNVQDSRTSQRGVPGHRNQNSSGGVSFRFEPNFSANAAASAAWQRALATWRCQTGINWEVGTPRTGRGAADDDENAVGFDNGAELPTNVLGRTTSYYRGCYLPSGGVSFYVDEIDMQFDDATNWQFGPANPTASQLDFESVAVHELGHAQQLSHLILPSAVMHYAIARGQRSRTLAAASDIAGGRYVLRTRSFAVPICSIEPMLPAPLTGQSASFLAGAGTTVQWTTRDECFVSGFVVERASGDTTAGWQAVGTMPAGATAGQYRLLDAQAPAGLNYYRVRVRRPDNSLDNAPPVGVTDDASALNTLQVFPNPVTGNGAPLGLQYVSSTPGTLTVRFFDAIGRYLGGTLVPYQEGFNRLTVVPPVLRAGYYLLRWTDSNGPKGTTPFVRTE
ncbi:matrixin family metalloprotease [Hymenobacter sp. HSC-4F20]|uniref:matrixin family metalloprotease n=1 Tax=Hymenobacter sp. HSC-4F20 TaxID=2864135 RepID=UPI001C72A98F|nr:matrixin family metalloprotease [Hymenobacter sp. HSC-4F20]MBX0292654.1 matrixin family metalloprotease [Hymenobacter sp. HSC-4F20]